MRLISAAFLLMVLGVVHAQSALAKLYAVIFDVTVNSKGNVQTLKVAKVIDPSTHTTNAVNVAVPKLPKRRQRATMAADSGVLR